jgi:hypothetical protein
LVIHNLLWGVLIAAKIEFLDWVCLGFYLSINIFQDFIELEAGTIANESLACKSLG